MSRIPLMIFSDQISTPTGLGRIHRELAQRIHANLSDTFELASMGYGGNTMREFPWPQYTVAKLDNWAINDLPSAWKDFAGERRGVLMAIANPSWLPWLADYKKLPAGNLRNMLESNPFERWLYAPVDAEGPNRVLSSEVTETLIGFDRVLAYGDWARCVIERSMGDLVNQTGNDRIDWLPHGIDTATFYPRDKQEARNTFLERVTGGKGMPPMKDGIFLIGVIATNTRRKNWGLCFEVCQELLKHRVSVGLWVHTDSLKKHWNIPELAKMFGMEGRIIPSSRVLTDEDMAMAYSACEVTFGIGDGEGFGYPIFESLACGTPCIHGNYAGAAEYLPDELKVKMSGHYLDGFYADKRPTFSAHEWATVALRSAYKTASLPPELDWNNLWPRWERWLLEGVNGK